MANLNLNYKFLIYEDCANKNPEIQLPNISKNIEGIVVDFDKSERLAIYSNEIKDIATTQRNVLWNSTTELEIYQPVASSDNRRVEWTGVGTAPNFRTNRNIAGAADTQVSITRVTNYVARITNTGGTAWNLTNVQVNDFIIFDQSTDTVTSPFSTNNQNRKYLVQNKGANYIDLIDNGTQSDEIVTLGVDFADVLKVISQGDVKVGDLFQISGAGINPSNNGRFEIVDVTDKYIEFVNPLGVDETVTIGTNSLVIYEYLIGFIHVRASAPVKLRFGSQTEWVQLERMGNEVIFFGSVCTHKIQAFNDRSEPVSISVQHCMVAN
jgi:hypothetical protein